MSTRGSVVVLAHADDADALRSRTTEAVQELPVAGEAWARLAEAAADAAPADVVVIAPAVRLPVGWLERLRAAQGSDGTAATVDALALEVTDLEGAAARVARTPARARQDEPAWDCTLVPRSALELAGPLDAGFAARASALGLLHVLAGDVLVARPLVSGRQTTQERPALVDRVRERARVLREPLGVTVDARILQAAVAGTQVHTLELLAALHRTRELRLRALIPPDPTPTAAAILDSLDGIELLDADTVDDDTPATPVVHRPYQVTSAIDLLTLRQVGERLVVTHQDLLTFHNPAYHADGDTWQAYRRLTETAMQTAHAVVAFSHHAAADLQAEALVQHVHVAPIGVDHTLAALATEPRRPATAPDEPFLLCLGTDLRHKNRPFAAALAAELRARHGWTGHLVLAGPRMTEGASEPVDGIDVGVPDEAEKAWLYAHAAAVVYPTTYEGFGLVPFEAAALGTPCLFAPQASLAEILGEYATLVPWDVAASADRAAAVLADPEPLVAGIRARAAAFTWAATAAKLLDLYDEALLVRPPAGGWAALEAEAARRELEHRHWSLVNDIGPTGMSLVGPEGLLPESAQRTLAALARRPVTRRPLLVALKTVGSLGR